LGLNGPWGLADISGSNVLSKPFVVINTSHAIALQVFSAAHQLYHIWYDLRFDVVTSEVLDPAVLRGEEEVLSQLKANHFAAEFLINEHTLLKEMTMNSINVKDIGVKDILQLSSVFSVPYRTMVRRFLELETISQSYY
jgi:Zn-dependent peptidase ImmA (M78 family)